jgi:hypothetical protein
MKALILVVIFVVAMVMNLAKTSYHAKEGIKQYVLGK